VASHIEDEREEIAACVLHGTTAFQFPSAVSKYRHAHNVGNGGALTSLPLIQSPQESWSRDQASMGVDVAFGDYSLKAE